jgi:hypothetical protein
MTLIELTTADGRATEPECPLWNIGLRPARLTATRPPLLQRALLRHTFEKALNAFVFDRAQSLGQRRLLRLERLLPEGRTSVAGDDLKRPIGVFETETSIARRGASHGYGRYALPQETLPLAP